MFKALLGTLAFFGMCIWMLVSLCNLRETFWAAFFLNSPQELRGDWYAVRHYDIVGRTNRNYADE